MLIFRVFLVSMISNLETDLETVYVGLLFLWLFYRMLNRAFSGNFVIDKFELIVGLLMLLPIIAGVGAKIEFNEPLIYGIGTFHDYYLILGALFVYSLLKNEEIDLKVVERSFVLTAWANLVLFYGLSLFTNPAQYISTALAGAQTAKGSEVYYRFDMAFMFFGTIYYVVKAFRRKNLLYGLFAFLFMFYIVAFRMDRTSMAVAAAGVGMYFLLEVPLRQKIGVIMASIIPIAFMVYALSLVAPDVYEQYYEMFDDAFHTLLGENDSSGKGSIRVYELRTALNGISEHPFLGNGKVSSNWEPDGYNHFLGYFYPSDVGIFGTIYMFGFVGVLILYSQFLLVFIVVRKRKKLNGETPELITAFKYLLLSLFLDSMTNSYIIIYGAQTVTALMGIYYFYKYQVPDELPAQLETKPLSE